MRNKYNRKLIYDKYNGHCAYCGISLEPKDMQIDHIEPILRDVPDGYYGKKKGTDDINNLNPCCRACNIRKGTLTIEEFRKELESCHERMMKYNANYRQLIRFGQIKLINKGRIIFFFEMQ